MRFPLTTLPTVAALATLPLTTGAFALLISRPSRSPSVLAIEDILLPAVLLALGGRVVLSNRLLRLVPSAVPGRAWLEEAGWPETVLLEGAVGKGGTESCRISSGFDLVLARVDPAFHLGGASEGTSDVGFIFSRVREEDRETGSAELLARGHCREQEWWTPPSSRTVLAVLTLILLPLSFSHRTELP